MRLVLATQSAHKLNEFRELLSGVRDLELISAREAGCLEEPEENGSTFYDNAKIKAQFVFDRTGLPCLADDSGLEVDALQGAPGVQSAYYAGQPRSDERNRHKLLADLKGVASRTARFRCVLLLQTANQETTIEGTCEGTILTEPTGNHGFGYDSLFAPTLLDGSTSALSFAQMSLFVKNQYSHRAKAVSALTPILNNLTYDSFFSSRT